MRVKTDHQAVAVRATLRAKCQQRIGKRVRHGAAHPKMQVLAAGRCHQLGRWLVGDQLSVIEDRYAVAQRFGLFQIMRCQDDCHPGSIQPLHIVPQLLAQRDINPGGWLVKHKDWRRMHHGLGHQQAPAHAAGKTPRIGMGLIGKTHHLQYGIAAALGWWHTEQASLHFQCFPRGEIGVDIQLLRHDPDIRPRLARIVIDIGAPDTGLPAGLDHRTCQNIDEGRFASAIRAQKTENTARRNIQRHAVKGCFRNLAVIGFLQIARRDGDAVFRGTDKRKAHRTLLSQRVVALPVAQAIIRVLLSVAGSIITSAQVTKTGRRVASMVSI